MPAGSSTRAWLAKEPGGVLVIRVDGVVVARVALAEVVEPKVQSRRVRGRGGWRLTVGGCGPLGEAAVVVS